MNKTSLPMVRDSWSFLFLERCKIVKSDSYIESYDESGVVSIPVAELTTLMLGPGVSITHDAVKHISKCGCSIVWCGEDMAKFYSYGVAETNKSTNLLKQVNCYSNYEKHMAVVRRMYGIRLDKVVDVCYNLKQLRGSEGARVRQIYADLAKEYGVEWGGRVYDRSDWGGNNVINNAITKVNAYLYSVCQSVVVSVGYSPAIGFIHSGTQMSFIYDVSDLYKHYVSLPIAFEYAGGNKVCEMDSYLRSGLRNKIHEFDLLNRIIEDIDNLFKGLVDVKDVGSGYWEGE